MKKRWTPPARWTPVEYVLLGAFLFWTGAGLIFTLGHITEAQVASWPIPPALVAFVDLCLQTGDPILILLACANTHLHASRQWTSGVARRWAITVMLLSYAIETVGAKTGFPFGPYHYTDNFGPVVGLVPLTIPLAWHVVVTNALFVVRAVSPYVSRLAEAIAAGAICMAYDFVLEPFATKIKGYWLWTGGSVPPINYIAWFGVSALLIWIFAPTLGLRHRFDPRPWLILGLTLLIFLAGEHFFA